MTRVLEHLCSDVISCFDFFVVHKKHEFIFNWNMPPLIIDNSYSQAAVDIPPPSLFSNLTEDCHPNATKSRQYSKSDREFNGTEITRQQHKVINKDFNSACTSLDCIVSWVMNQYICDDNMLATFAYLDNVIIYGNTLEEHNLNLKRFLEVAKEMSLTINEKRSVKSWRDQYSRLHNIPTLIGTWSWAHGASL